MSDPPEEKSLKDKVSPKKFPQRIEALQFVGEFAGDDGGDGCAFEGAGVEGRVAGFAG